MIKRLTAAGTGFVIALGLAAPFIRADRYGEQIRDALQRGLNRKVEIGKVRFNLFTGPGFTVENVVIYDDSSAGIEPFAHMMELDARVRLSSLVTGRLDFAVLRFVSPSVNIVKPESGPWNIVRLLQSANKSEPVPEIQVTDGRIFLKQAETKSSFYITAADITIAPGRDSISLRFSGEPASTDRQSRTAGVITARGTLSGGNLDLDVELERSPFDELGGLVRGHRLEYHGAVASRAKISGPLSKLAVIGSFYLADVHRWDLMNDHDRSWTVDYKGTIDASAERIELATVNSPNNLQLVISDLLGRPQWSVDMSVTELPASTLVSVARDLGTPVPGGVSVDGRVVGMLGVSSQAGLQGQLRISEGSVQLPDGPQLQFEEATLLIAGDTIKLAPAALTGEEGQGARLQAEYNTGTRMLEAIISGHGLRLMSRAAVPLVSRFQGGRWSAALRYRQSDASPGVWTGSFDVRETTTRVPGVSHPVQISTARLEIDGDALKVRQMRAAIGPLDVYGSYTYAPAKAHPHQFDLSIPVASLTDIESAVSPALRRDEGFFARTLRLRRAALPSWLLERKAEGGIRIGALMMGDEAIARGVRSRVVWEGAKLQLSGLAGRLEDASFRGTGSVDITKSEPQYQLRGRVENVAWKSGMVDLEGSLETLGSGLDLLVNLRGEGLFQARGLVLSPEQLIRTASGSFGVAMSDAGPQFKLSGVQASLGAERFTGDSGTLADGRLQMELASANRTVRVNLVSPITVAR
jgi:hypothetical protein